MSASFASKIADRGLTHANTVCAEHLRRRTNVSFRYVTSLLKSGEMRFPASGQVEIRTSNGRRIDVEIEVSTSSWRIIQSQNSNLMIYVLVIYIIADNFLPGTQEFHCVSTLTACVSSELSSRCLSNLQYKHDKSNRDAVQSLCSVLTIMHVS